ncbi:MAG: pyridoxal-phosphate dependent enzyme, partial [Phycisphaerae bacterium]
RVVAVEPEGCPSLFESFKQNKPASVDCNTICDGVAVPYMTDEVFSIIRGIVDDVVLVSDDAVKDTVKRLALGNRIVVEPSGALSVAAAIATAGQERGRSVCVVTGGSIDREKLLAILQTE